MKKKSELDKIQENTHVPLNLKKIKTIELDPVSLRSVKYGSSSFHSTNSYVLYGSQKPISKIIDYNYECGN